MMTCCIFVYSVINWIYSEQQVFPSNKCFLILVSYNQGFKSGKAHEKRMSGSKLVEQMIDDAMFKGSNPAVKRIESVFYKTVVTII